MPALDYHVTAPLKVVVDGRTHISFTVTEKDPTASSEWVIEDLPPFFTITLIESAPTQAGMGATVQPRIGATSGWDDGTFDHIYAVGSAATAVRATSLVRVTLPGRKLYGQTQVTGTVQIAVTRITLLLGHAS